MTEQLKAAIVRVFVDRQAKKRIQIEAVKVPGYRVMQGFSGTPVWDSQLKGVVGMVVESDKQEDIKVAYITPTDEPAGTSKCY